MSIFQKTKNRRIHILKIERQQNGKQTTRINRKILEGHDTQTHFDQTGTLQRFR